MPADTAVLEKLNEKRRKQGLARGRPGGRADGGASGLAAADHAAPLAAGLCAGQLAADALALGPVALAVPHAQRPEPPPGRVGAGRAVAIALADAGPHHVRAPGRGERLRAGARRRGRRLRGGRLRRGSAPPPFPSTDETRDPGTPCPNPKIPNPAEGPETLPGARHGSHTISIPRPSPDC